MNDRTIIEVVAGREPLPFIAEYCAFVWLHGDCNSEGDATSPLDREWSWLYHSDRRGTERFDVLGPEETGLRDVIVIKASTRQTALRGAYLTALRTGGRVRDRGLERSLHEVSEEIADLPQRLHAADRARALRGAQLDE